MNIFRDSRLQTKPLNFWGSDPFVSQFIPKQVAFVVSEYGNS